MDHVAIMKKSWGLLPKILNRTKKIESRWSINRIAPYDNIKAGDRVFFKNASEAVTVVVKVSRVQQFGNLTPQKVWSLLKEYGGADGIAVNDLRGIFEWAKNKKYCVLIHLTDPQKVEPFKIDKAGFGSAAAWLTIPDVKKIKI